MPEVKSKADAKVATASKSDAERRAAFVELVNPRLGSALNRIALIGKLARPRDYAYTDADVALIEARLTAQVQAVVKALRDPTKRTPRAATFITA